MMGIIDAVAKAAPYCHGTRPSSWAEPTEWTEMIMQNWTELELRFGAHAARAARANREGWWRPRPSVSRRDTTSVFSPGRQRLGAAFVEAGARLIGLGERLRRIPAAAAADPIR